MISMLFSTVSIAIAIGYLPQVHKLLHAETHCKEFSISCWLIWNYAALVGFLYSLFELVDLKMTLANGTNLVFINFILLIILYKRRKYATKEVTIT